MMANSGFRVTAIDRAHDYWDRPQLNRHFYVQRDDLENLSLRSKYDFINCISVLEHIDRHDRAIDAMFSRLNPGGHLLLTFPYCKTESFENIYAQDGAGYGQNAPYVCKVFCREQVESWLSRHGGRMVDQELWRVFAGPYWTFGNRIYPPQKSRADQPHQLACFLFQK